MNRRVEFTLNLDDPTERVIYETLSAALRHRRAGELIRQALTVYLFANTQLQPAQRSSRPIASIQPSVNGAIDEQTLARIVNRSAEMFGF